MLNIEFLRDVERNLGAGRSVPPESWLQRPLTEAQRRFLGLPGKYRGFFGGIGSGKSYLGSLLALSRMRAGHPGLVLAATYRQLGAVCEQLILGHLNDKDLSYQFKQADQVLNYNGCVTYFRSSERPDLLRGLSVAWCWLDEAGLMTEDLWRIVLGRLREGDQQEAFLTSTPRGFSWLWERFVQDKTGDYSWTQAATADNQFLPPEYVEGLERNYDGAYRDQELLGAFVAFEGLVFPEFSREVHVCEPFEIPASWERRRAIDFGYSNPFACLWAAIDHDGRIYIYDEHYKAHALLSEHVAAIRQRDGERNIRTVSDHDAQDRRELYALGVPTYAARKDVTEGLRVVRARLMKQGDGYPRLYIFPNCVNLIREIMSYCWQTPRAEANTKEEPRKFDDHAVDCLRYLCMDVDKGISGVATFSASALGL